MDFWELAWIRLEQEASACVVAQDMEKKAVDAVKEAGLALRSVGRLWTGSYLGFYVYAKTLVEQLASFVVGQVWKQEKRELLSKLGSF